jgi:hypothetical protein
MAETAPEPLTDVNADLSRQMAWEPSPSGTVWRKPLYRRGGEFGPVTSLVRDAPAGAFPAHAHPEGEEILVWDGIFSDEHGDYAAGTFLMNPHNSRHSPRSEGGCTLFVRLRQYPGEDRPGLVEDTRADEGWRPGLVDGLSVHPHYAQGGYPEHVALVRWDAGAGEVTPRAALTRGSLARDLSVRIDPRAAAAPGGQGVGSPRAERGAD